MSYKKHTKINKTFGINLRRFREERGLTQDDIAETMDTTKASISKYENGHTTTTLQFVYDLAEKYGMKPEDFVKEKEGEEK